MRFPVGERRWLGVPGHCAAPYTNYVLEMHYFGDTGSPPQFSPSDGGETTAAKGVVTSRSGHQMLKEI